MLFELAFDEGEGELGAVDGDVELGEDPGQAADVVLVAVGEDDGADLVAVFDEVADVGDDDVDAEQLFFGEHQAGVDDDDVILPSEGHAVHPELAEAAQRYDFQLLSLHPSSLMLTPGEKRAGSREEGQKGPGWVAYNWAEILRGTGCGELLRCGQCW